MAPHPFIFGAEDLFKLVDPEAYRSLTLADLPRLLVKLLGTTLLMWVYFAASIKRLHDRDKSGWWMVPFFAVPGLYNQFADRLPDSHADLPLAIAASALCLWGFIEMYCLKGSRKTNRFGADPLTPKPPLDTRPPWDQQSEIEMVPHKAGPPPVWRVKPDGMNDAVSITRDLVRCPSVTPADAGALGVLERLLKDAGFEVHRVTFGEPGTTDIDNLYARIGDNAPHITFAGHTDVVPAGDEAAWTHGAFSGEVKDGFLYGRGAVDMKGGIACSVAAVLQYLADNGGKPKGSISFLITGDEEDISVNGTIKLLKWCAERGEKFDHCVLGEPSNVEVLGDCIKVGRRGSQSGTLYVDGVQGHVAYPHRAANPVPDISRLIVALSDEPLDHGSAQFQASNLEFTSVDVGNTASNVIPAQARAKFNIRFNDNHTQETLRALVEERLAKACGNRIRARIVWEYSNSNVFVTKPGAFTDLAVSAIEEVTGRKPELSTSGGTSDARFISSYCPVIEFGLVGQTMHQVDERTPVSDLEKLTRIYRGVLDRYFSQA